MSLLEQKMAMIDCWMLLLTVDEAFVIRRHLIDGLEWARVAMEHRQYWGEDYARSERTLVRCQARAIGKIRRFIQEHPGTYLHLLDP